MPIEVDASQVAERQVPEMPPMNGQVLEVPGRGGHMRGVIAQDSDGLTFGAMGHRDPRTGQEYETAILMLTHGPIVVCHQMDPETAKDLGLRLISLAEGINWIDTSEELPTPADEAE